MAERKIYIPIPSSDPAVIAQQKMAQGQALREAAVKAGDALIETAGDIVDVAIAGGKTAIEFIIGVEGPPEAPQDMKDEPVGRACFICQREARDRANEESNVLYNESTEGEGDKEEKTERQKGDRIKSDDDALQQLEEIENAQRKVRKGKSGQIIDNIEKSKQRANDSLKPHNIDLDNLDDF